MRNKSRRTGWLEWAFCLAASAVLLMLCSMNSPLYPLNPWGDVNCFVTVAREMLEGVMPYRDLIEQKGPLLYAVYALAMLISPRSYFGIYLIEVLLMSGTMLLFCRTARLFVPKMHIGWSAAACGVLCAASSFSAGGSAEELCMLPVAASMYALMKSWKEGRPLTGWQYFLNGVAAGCIFWIKFNLLGFHFAWMGFQAVEALVRDRNLRRPVKMCRWFVGGMAAAAVPWLIWFGMDGALVEMLDVYLYRNAFYYRTSDRLLKRIAMAILVTFKDWRMCLLMVSALLGVTVFGKGRVSGRVRLFLLAVASAVFLSVYCIGRFMHYYPLVLALFTPFALIPFGVLGERLRVRRGGIAAGAVLLAVSVCFALTDENLQYIGCDYADTVQGQAAALTAEMDEPLLLNVNALDAGLYMALDAHPADEWFVQLNYDREACRQAQRECIAAGIPDLVACVNASMEELEMGGDYELLGELNSDFARSPTVYLYRKRA